MAQMSYEQALNKVMAICSKTEKCISDIEAKLVAWQIEPENISKIIQLLQNEKFIDQYRYAAYYVNDKFKFNKWGKVKIGYMLKTKGIATNIIREMLGEINEHDYLLVLQQLLKQKRKSTSAASEYEMKVKLTRFAQSRGFEYEIINMALREL